jgi:cold shock CspA family protein/ribosome-associated translation inhibitor RaiA
LPSGPRGAAERGPAIEWIVHCTRWIRRHPMQLPLQITFRDMKPSESMADYVKVRAGKLETFYGRLTSCRVVIEAPSQRHHHKGKRFHVLIDLTVPGAELVVGRNPGEALVHEDPYASIDAAFDDAQRVLEDHLRKRRGDVKHHEPVATLGRVVKIFHYEGFGFLEADEGYDVYFHRNAVLHDSFDRLEIGSQVRFVPADGENGPQATSVEPLRHHHRPPELVP